MKFLSASTFLVAATPSSPRPALLATTIWQSSKAEHILGFPEVKPHKKGILAIGSESVTFTSKAGVASIDRYAVTAVSAGNQRKEIWGMGGMALRAVIPDGGGAAAAMFMHHRVDMLTVEYRDKHGAIHGAVFFLPAHQADQALQSFSQMPAQVRADTLPDLPTRISLDIKSDCQDFMDPRSVLVAAPNWEHVNVPAEYKVLVYEHLIDRLRRTQGAGHVYRDGENNGQKVCPQYIIHISISTFKKGSQVKRAILGPAGMLLGTTQMTFDTTFNDVSGSVDLHKQVKGTKRGESESTNVAESVAKSIAKQYGYVLKEAEKRTPAQSTHEEPSLGRLNKSAPALGISGNDLH
jgi:hypothetical protein